MKVFIGALIMAVTTVLGNGSGTEHDYQFSGAAQVDEKLGSEKLFREAQDLEEKAWDSQNSKSAKKLLLEQAEEKYLLAARLGHAEAGLKWVEMGHNIQSGDAWIFVEKAKKEGSRDVRLRARYRECQLLDCVPGNQASQDPTKAKKCYQEVTQEAKAIGNHQGLINAATADLKRLEQNNKDMRSIWGEPNYSEVNLKGYSGAFVHPAIVEKRNIISH